MEIKTVHLLFFSVGLTLFSGIVPIATTGFFLAQGYGASLEPLYDPLFSNIATIPYEDYMRLAPGMRSEIIRSVHQAELVVMWSLFVILALHLVIRQNPLRSISHKTIASIGVLPLLGLICLPAIPIILQTLFYTFSSHRALLLHDLDYTAISSILSETSSGVGVLPSFYLPTGSGGSFLTHHFSPALLIYVPFYFFALTLDRFGILAFLPYELQVIFGTHLLYGMLLTFTLAVGLVLWVWLIAKVTPHPITSMISITLLVMFLPLWRVAGSFHYELLVVPVSAALFLSVEYNKKIYFWIFAFLWLGIKEDMAVYLIFYAIYLFTGKKREGLPLLIVSFLYFLIVSTPLKSIWAGSDAPSWGKYWFDQWGSSRFQTSSLFQILVASAFLPLVRFRLFSLVIAPIFMIHYFSYHPWHGTMYAHYSYSVLPFLMLGMIKGLVRVSRIRDLTGTGFSAGISLFALFMVTRGLWMDRDAPQPFPVPVTNYTQLIRESQKLPSNSCVIAETPLSSLLPLRVHTFPATPPKHNPWYAESSVGEPSNEDKKSFSRLLSIKWNGKKYCSKYFIMDIHGVKEE